MTDGGGPATFTWRGTTNNENLGLYLDAHQNGTVFVLGARVDTALLSPEEAERTVRTVEWMIVTAARRDVAVDELRARI